MVDRSSVEYIEKYQQRDPPLKAIRKTCLRCQGNSSRGVDECSSVDCPLWKFRYGKDPWRKSKQYTEEELEQLRNRLK